VPLQVEDSDFFLLVLDSGSDMVQD
jgi:hypothetical protein